MKSHLPQKGGGVYGLQKGGFYLTIWHYWTSIKFGTDPFRLNHLHLR